MPQRYEPGSDEWWFLRLARKLADDEQRLDELEKWGTGKPPLPADMPDLVKPHYRRLLEISRLHLADLPVRALSQRLDLQSFRTAAPSDDDGDEVAEALFEQLDWPALKTWAIRYGRAYTLVENTDDGVALTAETPRQAITEPNPRRRGESLAGLKVYRDAVNDRDVAVLFRADGTYREAWRAGTTGTLPGQGVRWSFSLGDRAWQLQPDGGQTGVDRCALTLFDLEEQRGRFEAHLPTLRRINHTIVQRMVLIALQAFRQRALKGAPKDDPQTGEPIDYDKIFEGDPGSLWILPMAVDMWESAQADFTPVLTAVKDDMRAFAVGTGTPIHILQPDAANGSAEGAALLRESLVFDAGEVVKRWTHPAARTLALGFEALGDTQRADQTKIVPVWMAPQRESLATQADALVKLKAGGVPWRARMRLALQAQPSQIREWAQERTADAFLGDDTGDPAAAVNPPAPAPQTAAEPPPEAGQEEQ